MHCAAWRHHPNEPVDRKRCVNTEHRPDAIVAHVPKIGQGEIMKQNFPGIIITTTDRTMYNLYAEHYRAHPDKPIAVLGHHYMIHSLEWERRNISSSHTTFMAEIILIEVFGVTHDTDIVDWTAYDLTDDATSCDAPKALPRAECE